jgi:hypothetical protein
VRVYDLRQMRSLSHIPFSEGPAFINTLPRKPTSIVITSHEGLVHIADVTATAETEVHQVNSLVSSITTNQSLITLHLSSVYHIWALQLCHQRVLTWHSVTPMAQFTSLAHLNRKKSNLHSMGLKGNRLNGLTCPLHFLR